MAVLHGAGPEDRSGGPFRGAGTGGRSGGPVRRERSGGPVRDTRTGGAGPRGPARGAGPSGRSERQARGAGPRGPVHGGRGRSRPGGPGLGGAQCDGVFGATPVARNIYDISQQRVLIYVRCVRRSTLCYVFVYAVHDFSVVCWRWLCSSRWYVFVYDLFSFYWVWGYRSKVCGDVCATCEATNHSVLHVRI